MDPQNHVERVVLNENNVFAYLESLGYDSSKLVKRNGDSTFFLFLYLQKRVFMNPYTSASKNPLYFSLLFRFLFVFSF